MMGQAIKVLLDCALLNQQLKCDGNSINSNSIQNCTVERLRCSGNVVSGLSYNGSLDNCTIERLLCPSSDSTSKCRHIDMVCNNSPSCYLDSTKFNCENNSTCYGNRCENSRKIDCNLNLTHPKTCNAEKYFQIPADQTLLDADWPCLYYDLDDRLDLGFNLDCRFVDLKNISEDVAKQNFTYFMINDKFALFEPANWTLKMKFFNFKRIQDPDSVVVTTTLGVEQMEGLSLIWFNTSTISQIPDKFYTGNRLYLEVGWDLELEHPSYSTRVIERRYIDVVKQRVPYGEKVLGKGTDWALIGILITVALLALSITVVLIRNMCNIKRE